MSEAHNPIRIAEDLASLPLPPEDFWVHPRRPAGRSVAYLALAGIAFAVVIAVALPLASRLAEQRESSVGAASSSPSPLRTNRPNPVECPAGQLPRIEHLSPPAAGDLPGAGAASAVSAFLRLQQNLPSGSFSFYSFDTAPTAPVWFVIDGDTTNGTFVAELHGPPDGNNWFAYPARFLGCFPP